MVNNNLVKRKHFLMRAIENKNCENIKTAQLELKELDEKIEYNIKELLKKNSEKLIAETLDVKTTVITEGDMKRAIAQIIINLLEEHLLAKDLKGVFRQGYKIMRTKC